MCCQGPNFRTLCENWGMVQNLTNYISEDESGIKMAERLRARSTLLG